MSREIAKLVLHNERETEHLAQQIAPHLKAGDTLLLEGEIGAGKTCFARALIRNITRRNDDVPSPTYTLIQTYDGPEFEIWHCDLYRLTSTNEIFELGLDDAFDTALTIIEWPDRLGSNAPSDALRIVFEVMETGRSVSMHASSNWTNRLVHLDD